MWLSVWFTTFFAWLSYVFGIRTRAKRELGSGRTIVIVGGGFAGANLAHYLESSTDFQIVLFEKKDYFEYTPAMLRVMVEPDWMRVSHLPFAHLSLLHRPRIRLVHEEVDCVTDKAVRSKSGEWVKYDKLVLAMGSDYYDHIKPDEASLTLAERKTQVQSLYESIESAPLINVFGAGLVGVELASEIAEKWPEKKLILRSREPHLLPGFPAKAQEYVHNWFENHGTEIILENSIPPHRYEKTVAGEVVFNCTGLKPVPVENIFSKQATPAGTAGATPVKKTAAIKVPTGFGKQLSWDELVDARTRLVKTTSQLHLSHHNSIFCIGDVMVEEALLDELPSARAPKVAYQAELQAWVVSENIKRQEEERPEWHFPKDVTKGNPVPTIVCCSLGKVDGLVIFDSIVVGGRISAFSKMFLEYTKMWLLRGNIIGELVWFITDPASLWMHRALLAIKRMTGSSN